MFLCLCAFSTCWKSAFDHWLTIDINIFPFPAVCLSILIILIFQVEKRSFCCFMSGKNLMPWGYYIIILVFVLYVCVINSPSYNEGQ